MTINDLIKDLQNLKPELKDLEVVIKTENGNLVEPKAKVLLDKYKTFFDKPERMIICEK